MARSYKYTSDFKELNKMQDLSFSRQCRFKSRFSGFWRCVMLRLDPKVWGFHGSEDSSRHLLGCDTRRPRSGA